MLFGEVAQILDPNVAKRGEHRAEWNKTRLVRDRLRYNPFYEEKEDPSGKQEAYYQGRHVIGRDTQINKGVYLGSGAREAIVVDDSKEQYLNQLFQALQNRRKGQNFKYGLLNTVWQLVTEVMPYDLANVRRVTRDLVSDQKINLTCFVGGGICRHQALLAGYLLERCKREGLISGHVSVDRNYVEGLGGHAWVRYTNSVGEIFIIDPAQKYIGKLEDIGDDRWFYERPEDISAMKRIMSRVRAYLQ